MIGGIDTTDVHIPTILQRSGRITNAGPAERVNLSPSAGHRRVQRLDRAR